MERDDTIHRCINAGCARAFPRRVNYCPWCGAAQRPGAMAPVATATVLDKAAATQARPAAAPAVPAAPEPVPASMPTPAPVPQPAPLAASPAPPRAVPPPPPPPPAPPPPPPPPPQPRPSAAAPSPRAPAPPIRRPIRLRWWLLALGALWLAWMLTKPTEARIERRMKTAIALAQECKPREAQDELIALRKTKATAAQLRQVQEALNDAAAACTRAERRREAWQGASAATEKLLRAGRASEAHARLSTFTRRWGEDERTRALRERIDAERHPLADPGRGE